MAEYLTTKEAAEALGMTQSAVQNALISGRLRGTKFGRDWQISAREVEHYRLTPKRSQGRRPRKTPPAP